MIYLIGIYSITNIMTGEMYIGESLNIDKRINVHLKDLKSGKHHNYKLQQSWNEWTEEWGEDVFQFEVIENCNPFNLKIDCNKMKLYLLMREYYYCSINEDKLFNIEKTLKKVQHQTKQVFYQKTKELIRMSNKDIYTPLYSNEDVSFRLYFSLLFNLSSSRGKDYVTISSSNCSNLPLYNDNGTLKDICKIKNNNHITINHDDFLKLFGCEEDWSFATIPKLTSDCNVSDNCRIL